MLHFATNLLNSYFLIDLTVGLNFLALVINVLNHLTRDDTMVIIIQWLSLQSQPYVEIGAEFYEF